MKATVLKIPEVLLIEPQIFQDDRGFFFESFNQAKFEKLTGLSQLHFVQDNHSRSVQGVLRGLHYQVAPKSQGKLVRVIQGEIFDVVVDIRPGSPNFGQWVAERLSAENSKQIWVPPGFAHGFLTLSETAEVLYKTTDYYAPEYERSLRYDDPDLAIQWPSEFPASSYLISKKDEAGQGFQQMKACFE